MPRAGDPTSRTVCIKVVAVVAGLLFSAMGVAGAAEKDGLLHHAGRTEFPIGFYELPANDADLQLLAKAGANLIRCGSLKDLDRAQSAGLAAWVPLPFQEGATDSLRKRVIELKDHPALAIWEGPDEVIWNFTAFSGLKETAGFTREDWWNQKPKAREYARREGARILPNIRNAIAMIRELDKRDRQVWINEAAESDVIYVRGYMDSIDITGCDYYPVKETIRNLPAIGRITDRWLATGHGKPVWMVLQAFSWHKGDPKRYQGIAYPKFHETRFMAWDAIVHGAKGVIYWGSETIDLPAFRTSLYAMTAELAALQPFLIAPYVEGAKIRLIEGDLENLDNRVRRGVRTMIRRSGDDWLVVLVNEDDVRHLGVEVSGLPQLDGRELHLLYGDEPVTVSAGEITTRMQAYETKIFSTSRRFEAQRREGRDFE
jgi:hypothetical protein